MGELTYSTQTCTTNDLEASIPCTSERIQYGRCPQAWLPINFILAQDIFQETQPGTAGTFSSSDSEGLGDTDCGSQGMGSLCSDDPKQNLVPGFRTSVVRVILE